MFHWMAVYPVTCALLLVVLFCLLQSWLLKKDFFSPVTVYCFSQCITLAIAYLQIDAFMSDFKPLTWMVWILGLVAFCSGCYVAKLSAKARSLPVRVVEATPPQGYNWRLHLVISFFLFALFVLFRMFVLCWLVVDDGVWHRQLFRRGFLRLFWLF